MDVVYMAQWMRESVNVRERERVCACVCVRERESKLVFGAKWERSVGLESCQTPITLPPLLPLNVVHSPFLSLSLSNSFAFTFFLQALSLYLPTYICLSMTLWLQLFTLSLSLSIFFPTHTLLTYAHTQIHAHIWFF